MPKVNVYLPDELAAAVRDAQVPVSAICQAALERAVREVTALRVSDESPAAEPAHGPFTRFTPRARKAVALAQQVAAQHSHDYVGTEHLLLGVVQEGGNLALKVLTALDIEPDDLLSELVASLGPASKRIRDPAPFTRLAKKALELAATEARALGHNYIGCEHLLLGVLATEDGLASQVLRRMGVELHTTRRAVITALLGVVQQRARPEPPGNVSVTSTLEEIVARLDAIEKRLGGVGD
jgi:ATP-dependent Clp protease ATP-binding subunit ClpC